MKILLIGPTDSIWVKAYIENVLLNQKIEITVIGKKNNRFFNFYKDNNIRIIDTDVVATKNSSIKKISRYICPLYNFFKEGPFDVLHVEYANHYGLMMASILSKFVKKTIVSYWGSDLFRATENELKKYIKYLNKVDNITLCTNSMKKYFVQKYQDQYNSKLKIIDYGANGFVAIDAAIGKQAAECYFDFPNDKIVVLVGYNGSEGQQHIKVIDMLKNLSVELQKKLYVVFPMTYAVNEEYSLRVKDEMNDSCEFEVSILEDYLTPDQMAELFVKSDCMIHAQITDALSASVQEILYAGKLVFNPEWLEYEEIDKRGVFYKKYKDFKELEELFVNYVNGGISAEEKKLLEDNKRLLYEYSSWEILKDKWLSLYF